MAFDPVAATDVIMSALSAEQLAKAKAYTIGSHWLLLWNFVVGALVAVLVLRWGVLVRLRARLERGRPRPNLAAFLVGALFFLLSWLLSLPWSIWADWKREVDYGRSSQPLADWLGQGALSMALSVLLGGLFFMGLYALIRRAPKRWWIWGSGFAGVAIAVMLLISPVLIEPLFNKFTPLPEGPVKVALEELKAKAGIPDARLVMFDSSRQSNNFTANVSGLGGSARIAIADVALKSATLAEVRGVTGHEIGHYVLGHVWRAVVMLVVIAVLGFWLVNRLFAPAARLMGAQGVTGIGDPAGLPVLLTLLALYMLLMTPVMNSNTRISEAEADNYSLNLAREPDGLATALVKTADYRYPYPNRLQEIIFYSHPSVSWRVRNAMAWKAKAMDKAVDSGAASK
ncbi:M48 family metalloprotease [Sandaracinobacteroides saxicola]|uniref:M48 family metalloprotease n=2 Tax=Sandaracinobacteroides saxicola TaxID=2759707 RepID=A0A7G5IMR9_9SPHN|nr:M48 family metalloprotease [Sandaracinobacteroides saxicola]